MPPDKVNISSGNRGCKGCAQRAEERQRARLDKQRAIDTGFASVIRETAEQIQIQSSTLGRVWILKQAIHPDSSIRRLGEAGTLRIRKWYADLRRIKERKDT